MSPEEVFNTIGVLRNAGWLQAIRSLSDADFGRLVQMQEAEDAIHEELDAIWGPDWVPPEADPQADSPAGPDDSCIDQFIRSSARRAANREDLIEPTPFDSPGPFHMNLDWHEGDGNVVPFVQPEGARDGEK